MTYGLPAHGELNWDTKLVDSITAVKATADAAQPSDSDLTAIAALTTTPFGRSLLTQADATAARSTLGSQADLSLTSSDAAQIVASGGNLVTSGEATLPRNISIGNVTMTSGFLRLAYFTARKSETINNVRIGTTGTAAGATPTLVRVGLYTVDGSGNLTLVASTANDTTLLAATNTAYTKALSAGYAKVAGVRYAVGVLVVTAAAAPTIMGLASSGATSEFGLTPRVTGSVSGQTDLPSSVAVGSIADTTNFPYIVVTP